MRPELKQNSRLIQVQGRAIDALRVSAWIKTQHENASDHDKRTKWDALRTRGNKITHEMYTRALDARAGIIRPTKLPR